MRGVDRENLWRGNYTGFLILFYFFKEISGDTGTNLGQGLSTDIMEMTFLTEQHRCLILVMWVHENEVTHEHTGSVFTSE